MSKNEKILGEVSPSIPTPTPGTKVRKPRSPTIKYDKIVESGYAPVNGQPPTNPLDMVVKYSRGGLTFAGIEFENSAFGVAAKIPSANTAILNPTLRQVVVVLDKLYAK